MAKQKPETTEEKEERNKKIRKAYRAGRKTIVLNGQQFTIERKDKNAKFTVGGEQHTQRESWLFLNPVAAHSTAVICIELTDKCNMRSKV